MQVYIRILVLFAVSSFVSLKFHVEKERVRIKYMAKPFLFYISILYALLVVIKKFSKKTSIALLYGFVSDSVTAYLLYSIPLILFSAVMPLLLKKVLQKKRDDFISMTLSMMASFGTIIWFFLGEIDTRMSFCIIAGGSILALAVTCFYKKEVHYCKIRNIRKYLLSIFPVISFWTILMVLYLPNELYLNNVSDMEVPYGTFIIALLLGSIICLAVYLIGYVLLLTGFCTEGQLCLVNRIFFAFTLAEYVQGLLLNGKMNKMDGMRQKWSTADSMGNLFFWFLLILIIVFLPYFIKKNIDKIYSASCIYISMILLASWGYMGIVSPKEAKEHFELTDEGRLELSPEHNVLVFVLDWFDWQIADRIFENDPGFGEPLNDFTWYKNSSSCYAFTAFSIPYLLTNVEWQYDMGRAEYRDYAYENTDFLADIAEQNLDIGVYTYSYYLTEDVEGIVHNYTIKEKQDWNYLSIVRKMVGCSKYKSYPFLLKDKYWYYVDSRFFMEMKKDNTLAFNPGDDDQFYDALLTEGIQINEGYDGAYRFYHLVGAHPPFEPDMFTKGKKCLEIVYEYLEQLKNKGLYDDATIIITADHGQNYLDFEIENIIESYDLEDASSPILFVKKAGQRNETGPELSTAPVSHSEFAATVMEAVAGSENDYGDTFSDITDENRERYFVYKSGTDPSEKYLIQGDVRDWNNWHLQEQ